MKIVRDLLAVALAASGLVGTEILLTDKWLWYAAPSHAYGLVIFVAFDAVFAVAAFVKIFPGSVGAGMIATLQFVAMLADIVIGQPEGIPSASFRSYLLNDSSYIALLLIQFAILLVALGGLVTPHLHRHGRWRITLIPRHK